MLAVEDYAREGRRPGGHPQFENGAVGEGGIGIGIDIGSGFGFGWRKACRWSVRLAFDSDYRGEPFDQDEAKGQ